MNSFKSLVFSMALLAIVVPLCVDWTQAQKTRQNSFQQQIGAAPNSVYGGYQTSSFNGQRQSSQVSPVARQRPAPVPQAQVIQQQRESYESSQQSVDTVQRPRQQQPAYQQQQQQVGASSSTDEERAEADSEPASYGAVAGQPGTDFPSYTRVPKTSFTCEGKPYDYGMYADEETGCQAYHVCYNGRKDSFLCGTGTVFNQRILHCDYWYSVDCGASSQYYGSNAYMGSSQPEPGPAQAGSAPAPQAQGASYQSSSSQVSSSSINRPASAQRSPSQFNRNNQQQQIQEPY